MGRSSGWSRFGLGRRRRATDASPAQETRAAEPDEHLRHALAQDAARAAGATPATASSVTPPGGADSTDAGGEEPPARPGTRTFGLAGMPIDPAHPFYVGFVGALGVLTAYTLWRTVAALDTVITLLLVAFFLTLALNPLVTVLQRRGLRRSAAVGLVFLGLVLSFALIALVVVPPVSQQGAALIRNAPTFTQHLLGNEQIQEFDRDYQVLQKVQDEVNRRVLDADFMSHVFGGVLGAAGVIASGVFSTLTVLVLTLYLLASLPTVKQAAYALVPASRRPRVVSLSEEIMRRVGSYAIGQVAVASVNAFCAYIMMSLLDLPYAAVLAVGVGFLGLVPMVGATLGAALVAVVAVFDDPKKALIAIVYFIVYQQLENYLVMPRIMQRTVSVPGGVTVVAALAGGTLLGMLGALLAIPTAAGLLLLYEEVLVPRQRRH